MNRIAIAGTTLETPLVSPTGAVQVEVKAHSGLSEFITIVRADNDLARYLTSTGLIDKPGTPILVFGQLIEHEPTGFHLAAEHLALDEYTRWAADNV